MSESRARICRCGHARDSHYAELAERYVGAKHVLARVLVWFTCLCSGCDCKEFDEAA